MVIFLILWEVGFRFDGWFGVMVPFIGKIDAPSLVVMRWSEVVYKPGYWESWYLSFGRVFFWLSRCTDSGNSVCSGYGCQ
jgi:NitT/TauT family transport system permease protein